MANAGQIQTTGPGFGESKPMTDEPEKVETILPADASVLVATAAGELEFVMANGPTDAQMQPNVLLLSAVMLRSRAPEWVAEMMAWLEAQDSSM